MLAGQVHRGETKVVAVQQETLAMAVDATDWVRKSSFASFRTMYFILICVTFFALKKMGRAYFNSKTLHCIAE